jgi:hypothetical protein
MSAAGRPAVAIPVHHLEEVTVSEKLLSRPPHSAAAAGVGRPPEVADLLAKVGRLLDAGDPRAALDLVGRAKLGSPWVTNAVGVCLLRLGQAGRAVELFRGLVLGAGGLVLRADLPAVIKANYARALLAADHLSGFLSVLAALRSDADPAARRLVAAFDAWYGGLSFWQRVRWSLGGRLDRPLALDGPPGEL